MRAGRPRTWPVRPSRCRRVWCSPAHRRARRRRGVRGRSRRAGWGVSAPGPWGWGRRPHTARTARAAASRVGSQDGGMLRRILAARGAARWSAGRREPMAVHAVGQAAGEARGMSCHRPSDQPRRRGGTARVATRGSPGLISTDHNALRRPGRAGILVCTNVMQCANARACELVGWNGQLRLTAPNDMVLACSPGASAVTPKVLTERGLGRAGSEPERDRHNVQPR